MPHGKAAKHTHGVEVPLSIALVFSDSRVGPSGMLRGIGRYARGCGNWELFMVAANHRLHEALVSLNPSGIIVSNFDHETVKAICMIRRPVVNVGVAMNAPSFHRVRHDETSVGAMAANHLIECGLKNFGYFGPPWGGPTSDREGGFFQTLHGLSHTVNACYLIPPGINPSDGVFMPQKKVLKWIRNLPKPAGVFAPSDRWALWLCGVCRQEGIKVPEEVAVVGAENDELICNLMQPSISSVVIPCENVGYEAAALLDRLMHHEPMSDEPLLLRAVGVVTRQSTDILAVSDPDLRTAISYMREHIAEPITVDDVLRHACLPRRSFDRKFIDALGRSPVHEMRRMRVEMAKTLLASDARIKIENIVSHCGFFSRSQFFTAFQQVTGVTPADYRRTMGLESGRKVSSVKFLADFSADSSSK
jgi:LacI family transcriptional regulator